MEPVAHARTFGLDANAVLNDDERQIVVSALFEKTMLGPELLARDINPAEVQAALLDAVVEACGSIAVRRLQGWAREKSGGLATEAGTVEAGLEIVPAFARELQAARADVVAVRETVRETERALALYQARAEVHLAMLAGDTLGKNADERKRNLTIMLADPSFDDGVVELYRSAQCDHDAAVTNLALAELNVEAARDRRRDYENMLDIRAARALAHR